MRWACSAHGRDEKLILNFIRKYEHGRPRPRIKDNIKQDMNVWSRFIWLRIGTSKGIL
jgi:hypothetical protein